VNRKEIAMLTRAHSPALSWDRSAVLVGVIALHIGGIWLVSVYGGLGRIAEKAAEALQVVDVTVPEDAPRPPPPIERPRLLDPMPELPRAADLPDLPPLAGGEITVPTVQEAGAAGGSAVVPPPAPPTPMRYRETRAIDDFYPPVSIRLAEGGVATVRACIDASGRLQDEPSITSSSGHARLDAAAAAWARESLSFTPGTRDGKPVGGCKDFRVRFRLR
jgi:protein TonB